LHVSPPGQAMLGRGMRLETAQVTQQHAGKGASRRGDSIRCRGPPAIGGRSVLGNHPLCRIGQKPPPEDAVAHAAPHVVAAAVLHDGSPAVWARAVLDSVYPVGEERIFHPIPQPTPEAVVGVVPLVFAHPTLDALLTAIPHTNARHLWPAQSAEQNDVSRLRRGRRESAGRAQGEHRESAGRAQGERRESTGGSAQARQTSSWVRHRRHLGIRPIECPQGSG